jgi:ABC-2 type transport system ATP-binding protein
MATVSVSHIRKRFGSVKAVEDVSFEVQSGEVFGLLGPNGAGKTTTIRMMLDIFRPDGGEVAVLGGALDEEKKNRIGYMPEERGLYKDLKLEPTLIYLAMLKGLDGETARRRLEPWLRRLDLYAHRQKKVQELSRGMQQKAQLIATLVHEPDLIVVDEPFAGLDPVNTRLVKDIMEEERQAGRAIVMSTHQMHQVETLCNRIVLINRGRSVLYGDVDQIKREYRGNAVLIEGEGELPSLPGVLEIGRGANGANNGGANGGSQRVWHVALAAGTTPQDLFRSLAQQTAFQVERFEIAEPSLEEIFVSVVQQETDHE